MPVEADPVTVAVVGAGPKTGVTHLGIWISNYLRSVCGHQTALLEWNSHEDFERIGRFCIRGKAERQNFRILGVDYVPSAGAEEFRRYVGAGYEAVVVDFGEMMPEKLTDYLLCERRILIGACSEWQVEAFTETLEMQTDRKKGWRLAATFGSGELEKEIMKKYGCRITRIPFVPDAYTVTGQDIQFLEKLLG